MLGAIIGDIAGSRFEFVNNRTKPKQLFVEDCFPTDDSYLTVGVFNSLLECEKYKGRADYLELLKKEVLRNTLFMYMAAPSNAGFGGKFAIWCSRTLYENNIYSPTDLFNKDDIIYEPNNSAGNGCSMKISPVPYFVSSLEECIEVTKAITSVSHNHEESFRAACCLTTSIYLALNNKSKEEIRDNILKYYPEVEGTTYKELREDYVYSEFAPLTMIPAMSLFIESTSFEDCLLMNLSIGGDADTLGAISSSLAEAYYKEDIDINKILKDINYDINASKFNKDFYNSILKMSEYK